MSKSRNKMAVVLTLMLGACGMNVNKNITSEDCETLEHMGFDDREIFVEEVLFLGSLEEAVDRILDNRESAATVASEEIEILNNNNDNKLVDVEDRELQQAIEESLKTKEEEEEKETREAIRQVANLEEKEKEKMKQQLVGMGFDEELVEYYCNKYDSVEKVLDDNQF